MGCGLLDADLKALQIDLPQSPLGHLGVVVLPVGLLVVAGKVLGAGGDAVLLDAPNHRAGSFARQQGILGEVLEIPTAQGIAVDVHPGPQQHVAAFLDHLTAVGLVEALHQGGIPGAGQAGAAGQQGAVVLQPDAGSTGGGVDGGHALLLQALDDAAHDSGVALSAQRAVHDKVPVGQGFQLLRGQLSHKVLHGGQSRLHVLELDALIPGEGDLGGQVVQDPLLQRALSQRHGLIDFLAVLVHQPVKLGDRGAGLLELGGHLQLTLGEGPRLLGGAHIGTHKDVIVSGLQHPGVLVAGGAGVIEAGHGGHREGEGQGLGLAKLEQLGLLEGAQHSAGLAQLALRSSGVDLHHLFAGAGAGVLHRRLHPARVPQSLHLDVLQGEGGVG